MASKPLNMMSFIKGESQSDELLDFEFDLTSVNDTPTDTKNIINDDTSDEKKDDTEKVSLVDKHLVMKNFRYLLENSEYKIGEIEAESGNAKGYVSRLESGNNSAVPNLNFLVTVSKKFDVTLDCLLFNHIDELSQSEALVLDFLENLIKDTEQEKVLWDSETTPTSTIDTVNAGRIEDLRHVALYNQIRKGTHEGKSFTIIGKSYRAKLPNSEDFVYALRVDLICTSEKSESDVWYEILIKEELGEMHSLCQSKNVIKELSSTLAKFFSAIERAQSHIRINDNVKNIIKQYLYKE